MMMMMMMILIAVEPNFDRPREEVHALEFEVQGILINNMLLLSLLLLRKRCNQYVVIVMILLPCNYMCVDCEFLMVTLSTFFVRTKHIHSPTYNKKSERIFYSRGDDCATFLEEKNRYDILK